MNEQFYELPEEKRERIIRAGLEVFSKNDYKRAVTDDIALKAGISKGLLFYYFHNKKSFYMFLFEYAAGFIAAEVMDRGFDEITDFFELIEYAAKRKLEAARKAPYLMDFIVRCYYAADGTVSEELDAAVIRMLKEAPGRYFGNVDYSRFKDDIDPGEVYDMLLWMTEGYISDRHRAGQEIDMEEIMELFYKWKERLKKVAYKKAYGGTAE